MNPIFSIVIPTYNRAGFLPDTLNSILKQTFPNYEIIIVDDGSTDNTKETLKPYIEKHSNIKYFWQKNQERGAARNFGITQADGGYIVFFDSDDEMLPDYLETLHQKITELNKPNFIAAKYELQRNAQRFPSSLKKQKGGWHNIELFIEGNPLACHFCIRKNNSSLKLFEEQREYASMEDWMFLIQNIANEKIYLIDKTTILLNDHSERSMQKDHNQVISARLLATQWIIKKNILNKTEQKKIRGYSFYFCAIHSYLDNKRVASIIYLFKSVWLGTYPLKLFLLFLKSIAGRKNIQFLKGEK